MASGWFVPLIKAQSVASYRQSGAPTRRASSIKSRAKDSRVGGSPRRVRQDIWNLLLIIERHAA